MTWVSPHRASIALSAAIVLNQTIALICQFAQHTDRTFPLLYFTVDSAVFAGAVASVALASPCCSQLPSLRAGSAVAVLLSALIFATVIAPASVSGTWIQPYDDYWVRTATFLFHLVAPVLVAIDFVVHDIGRARFAKLLAQAYIWPFVYLAGLSGLRLLGAVDVPYPFLDPTQVGWWTVVGSLGVLALLVLLLTVAQLTVNRWWHGPRS
jgi:hypothetical protein